MSRPILWGASFKIVDITPEGIVTTDKGNRWTVFLPPDHTVSGHANLKVGDILFAVTVPETLILDVGVEILTEVFQGCGCKNIRLRVESLGQASDALNP